MFRGGWDHCQASSQGSQGCPPAVGMEAWESWPLEQKQARGEDRHWGPLCRGRGALRYILAGGSSAVACRCQWL